MHFAAKEYSEAIACWTEARALVVASYPVGEKNNNRGAAICCANISAAQLLLGDAEEALRSAQASMRYDRTYKKALLREARALSRMGCHEEARFAEALHALPDESFENCGRTFINEVHSQESVVEQQAMFMDIVSALRNDDGGGGGGGGDGDGDGGGQDGASVAAVGAEPANARWRAQLSAWGLRREVDAVPVGDLEGAAQLLADVVEAQALEHLYRRNGNAEPPPLLANFSFVRKFLTPHDLPCLKGMVLSQHCWGAKLQAFLPIPLPGWPDNDPFPWDAAAHVARVKPGHSGNGKPLRGRLIWCQRRRRHEGHGKRGEPVEGCMSFRTCWRRRGVIWTQVMIGGGKFSDAVPSPPWTQLRSSVLPQHREGARASCFPIVRAGRR